MDLTRLFLIRIEDSLFIVAAPHEQHAFSMLNKWLRENRKQYLPVQAHLKQFELHEITEIALPIVGWSAGEPFEV